ncbi:MAG TPA: tRNA (guanosine(46)-N7)-methyltransferase TrmB [Candidatus Kapabacteria bacterium]|nr:tRNA (guanosine(46)-N7)-methyltransferase TrmB [Candidatus Kapabacteria bacterium]
MTVSSTDDQFILRSLPIIERLPLEKIFSSNQPLEVEIGAGDGSFLVAYAKVHPELNLIGLERLLGRLRKIDRKARRAGLQNIRLLRLEASYFVQYMLPPGSVNAFHIYFPDPWPKRRHWKNRLIEDTFTRSLQQALRPGGIVYLRTDDQPYFTQMLEVFARNSTFEKMETPAQLLTIVTDFERNFHLRGVATNHATYRKV